ncbi:K02A2.6-like, partial [Cordylochernes scorpioides]
MILYNIVKRHSGSNYDRRPMGLARGAASNGGEVAIEENPPGYIAAKLKENFVMVEINGRKIKALVDSGADFSVISDKFRRELKTPLFKEPGPILKAANKNLIETLGKCVLNIEVNGLNISFEFVVMVECSHDIIFGWDFFKATEAVIDCGRNELHLGETSVLESREEENQRLFASDDFVIPPKSIKKISVINEEICSVRDVLVSTSKDLLLRKEVLIPNSLVTFRHGRGSIWVANGASWPQLIPSGMNMCTMESYDNGNICSLIESSDKLQETQLKSREWSQKINLTLDPGLSEIQRLQLVSCLDEFIGIFDFGSTPIKPTSTVKHKINTGDQSPIKQRPYRVAPSERRLIQDEVNKMIENLIVKPSESPWSSPVILVRKKDGTWRFCVDYRRLNKTTKKDVYPLPRIDDALDSLAGSSYFSTMDLRSGYWQIEVDKKDREKTAFITPDGLYEFQVMPFGLCNAPATFERMIDSVLGSLKWNMCLCYLDDIVVYAPTFEEHLRRLQLVLSCIQKAGLSLNHKKCLFGSRRIKILGHLVDANGIHPDPDKVEAVSKFPRPRNISELRSFLGLCSYYRRFIENFADKARSLHDLLKTEKQFYWDAAQEKAFEVLKTALISEPVLGHFDESADTHLHTDASGHGIGAVFLQIQEIGSTLERCKKPFDKTSLKSFLGMLSFYSKYIPNMSTLAGPLYQLLKKDNRWKWSSQCEKAFLNLKLTLLNSQALIHYSMKLPLTLTCDASAYGISGVLCHIVEGEEKPITFVSRTLSSAEAKYSQTEKEALAIVFATSKLRQYLFGRKFVLKSDHKALTTVFGNKRLLPPLIANRLHRWALELSNFDFDIRYTNKDTMLCADAFSRLPLEEINSREDNIDLVTHDISFLNVTPLDHLIIEEETNKDPVLNKLKEYLLEDPQLAKKDETMKPFLSKLEIFSILQGCIFVDSRAVIPRTCQDQMLKLLHQGHIGINRMKSLARSSVWWPKMDSQIEEFVKECSPCMHHQTAPPAENTPWPRTNQPWQRVHVDHFYFRGDCYLLVVDANSNWIEVFPVRGTTSQENIKLLRECFARYGLPQCLVSDNGPPFNSLEFKEFLRKNNVYHLTSPAYNPSSNGIAEVSVRIIKKSLEKSLEESPNSNMDCILQNVLFNYRNTPTSLDKPPVERLLSYVPRTFVNCLNSEFIQRTFGRNECGRRNFQVGDKVLFTRVIQNRRKWFKAQVIRRLGYNVYLVKNLKGTFKVHVNQMRTGSDTKYAEDSDWTLDNAGAGPRRLEQDPQISTSPPPRRSTQPRCPPCRFSPT